MRLFHTLCLLVVATGVLIAGCKKSDHHDPSSSVYIIKAFTFTRTLNTGLTVDVDGVIGKDTISVLVPPGIQLTRLVPTITYQGASLSPADKTPQDFSTPVRYTVTAQNGMLHTWVVVVRNQSTDKSIISFQLRPQENPGLSTTINGIITNDTITVPYSGPLPLSGLTPYVTYTGVRLSPNSGEKKDFTQPVFYNVTAEDGSIKEYRVSVVQNKLLYIGSDDGNLYAIDASTGVQCWKFSMGGSIRSSPTLAAGTVYVGSGNGYLYAVDSATGSLKWRHGFSQPVYSCPTVSGGSVFVYCAANLVSLDTATGNVNWQYYTNDLVNVVESPTVANGMVYVSTYLGSFSVGAINVTTGKLVWGYQSGGLGRSNPAVVNGVVYAGQEGYTVVALDAFNGAEKWHYYNREHGGSTSPTVAAGKVFSGDFDGSIYALDSATGALQWNFASNGIQYMGYQSATGITVGLWSSPVYANGIVFAGNNDGENYAINAATGRSAWIWYLDGLSANPAATQATVANGTVFFGTTGGQVMAMDAASGVVKWTFQTNRAVYSGACVVGIDGTVYHPGESGDTQ
ncbi:hypothetical protein A4H97_29550 [Niastella yeongjuensis]|uniref:Pyrrolo-quinoline quinone repeat domain-containing protein n=1 Tax=Niastella yeongjuensis TaxID=354355 RepID=A0A1V9ES97_9BACT|nr:PQQ-binding-like beta-propeller repeat protein [Niastella yeongjuensis]OQP49027.1 hypothetical protein A4H97_29550 [Niastella yeongjuensis]SEP10807.1 Outer membrane protein assembly factor BamB, contains PQQ-like beta-propeller repeat [Niastella yeongjuensis]